MPAWHDAGAGRSGWESPTTPVSCASSGPRGIPRRVSWTPGATESAFRQEITLTLILTPLALWLGRTPIERTLLIVTCVMVLVVELLNSAVEAAIDRHGDELHELSGRAKDLGSAAVMLSLGVVVAVWAVVAYERFVLAVD